MTIKAAENAVEVQHERARYFLYNLGLVLDAFDPDCPPSELSAGVPENSGKSLAYLLDLCRLWREPNDEFPDEFAAVQPTPVDCCGEIASSYHWLCWLLSQRILAHACRALLPGAVIYHPEEAVASLEESHFVNADWQEVSHAAHLKSPGCVEILDVGKVDRLLTVLHQEYARAGYLLGKVHEPKEPPPEPPAPVIVSLAPPRVTVEGVAYPVVDNAARLRLHLPPRRRVRTQLYRTSSACPPPGHGSSLPSRAAVCLCFTERSRAGVAVFRVVFDCVGRNWRPHPQFRQGWSRAGISLGRVVYRAQVDESNEFW